MVAFSQYTNYKLVNRDKLQSKICDLITDVTVDPSDESIAKTTSEIMKLVDEYEHGFMNTSAAAKEATMHKCPAILEHPFYPAWFQLVILVLESFLSG